MNSDWPREYLLRPNSTKSICSLKKPRVSYWTGKKRDANTLAKLQAGRERYFLEHKDTQEYKDVRFRVTRRFLGENNPNWKGGVMKKPEYVKAYRQHISRMRKMRVKNVGGSHSLVEWEAMKMRYRYMCLCCKKCEPEIVLTVDHVMPISKGGSNNIDNIQPLCRSCNSIKMVKVKDFRKDYVLVGGVV